jgi:predicted phosphodiesterase
MFRTPLGGLLLCHGVGTDDMDELKETTSGYGLAAIDELGRLRRDGSVSLMVGGHTHAWMDRAFDGLRVINPGTLRARDDRASGFCVLDLASGVLERFEIDSEGALSSGGGGVSARSRD